jgi:N6-adenosine-specific RNA methylase IME4
MLQLPPGPFDLILADPPWRFLARSRKGLGRSPDGPLGHYDTMDLLAIKSLPVASVAAQNAILALWVVDFLLPEGIAVMEAWGFEYRTVGFTWVKTGKRQAGKFPIGMGYYTRGNPEMCLIGQRGKGLKRSEDGKGVPQLVMRPRGEHSEKPAEIQIRLEKLFGPRRRLELFARRHRRGWRAWGDQLKLP